MPNGQEEMAPVTDASAGTPSASNATEKATGQSQPSPDGSPASAGYVSGLIIRRPGERMYGTLTLTRCYATKVVMTDYYGVDISETGKRAICGHLDAIAALLSTESGIISSEIPLNAPECRTVPSEKARLEKSISDAQGLQQKLLWEDSGE